MSIKLMTKVWENGPEDRTEAMVLLALADRANDDGSSCFPSIAEVSQRSRLSRRGTQKVIRRLDDKGYLTVHENQGPGGTNNYKLHPGQLEGRTEFAGGGEHDSPRGERHSPGGEPDDEKGRSTFARNRQEPSDNRQKNRDGDAHAPESFPVEVDKNPFSFLSPRHQPERAEMREDLAWIIQPDNPSVQADRTEKVARRLLGGPKQSRKKVPIRRVMRQIKEHPVPACIAAWTLAETKNSPFAYANSLLNSDDESEPFYTDADESEDEWALADG